MLRAGGSYEWERSDPSSGRIVKTKLLSVQLLYNPPPACGGSPLPRNVGLNLSAYAVFQWQSTVTLGWRRDEGVPPYRGGVTPNKNLSCSNEIPTGGRGTPLPRLIKTNNPYTYSRNAQ